MKKSYFVIFIVSLVAISCFSDLPKIRAIKAKPELRTVITKYSNDLKSKTIGINPAWTKFDTIVTHKIILTVLDPEVLPTSSDDLTTLSKRIAKDIYLAIENNHDFSICKSSAKCLPVMV